MRIRTLDGTKGFTREHSMEQSHCNARTSYETIIRISAQVRFALALVARSVVFFRANIQSEHSCSEIVHDLRVCAIE